MLFILFFGLTLFILLIIGYNVLDIRKDPYFIRVRKEFYNLEIEYILDVWNMTAKKCLVIIFLLVIVEDSPI